MLAGRLELPNVCFLISQCVSKTGCFFYLFSSLAFDDGDMSLFAVGQNLTVTSNNS